MSAPEPFDPSRSKGPVRTVPASSIVDLLPLTHAPERVADYREAMLRGERFPPVAVVRLAGRWVLADGHKRLTAARGVAVEEIPVEVWSFGRWSEDQRRQLRDNFGKNRRIAALALRSPREAGRLLGSTLAHWLRVMRSLWVVARRRRTGGRPGKGPRGVPGAPDQRPGA